MVLVGDVVERQNARGRVTGFCPNGKARVVLDNGQRRHWPPDDLSVITRRSSGDPKLDQWRADLEAWAARVRPEILDKILARLERAGAFEQSTPDRENGT